MGMTARPQEKPSPTKESPSLRLCPRSASPSAAFRASCRKLCVDDDDGEIKGSLKGGGPGVRTTRDRMNENAEAMFISMDEAARKKRIKMKSLQMEEIRTVGSRTFLSTADQLNNDQIDRAMERLDEDAEGESDEGGRKEGSEGGHAEADAKAERKGDDASGKASPKANRVAVFNANSTEGCSIVRTLAKQGREVVAIVRVTTSRNVRQMVRLEHVTVLVADSLHDKQTIADAICGCSQVFYVLKYWEKFDGALEEIQAFTIFDSCAIAGANWVIFATYEDASLLRRKRMKSQIVPRADGTVAEPSFAGLKAAKKHAAQLGIRVTHMITSYLDHKGKKRSLTLIKGEEKLIVVSNN